MKLVGNAVLLDLSIEDSFLHMMHSDLLIGSGSTLPIVAGLFSTRTLYVNVKPKTGWNFLSDFLPEGLVTTDDGVILNPPEEIMRKLFERRQSFASVSKRPCDT